MIGVPCGNFMYGISFCNAMSSFFSVQALLESLKVSELTDHHMDT